MQWIFFGAEKLTSFVLLGVLCVPDIKSKTIPNKTLLPFAIIATIELILGFIIRYTYTSGFARMALTVCVFFFGMTGWIGLGDIKVLMILSLLNNPMPVLIAVVIACGLIIIWEFIKNPKEAIKKIRFSIKGVYQNTLPKITKNNKNTLPFIPFLLLAYFIITGGEVLLCFR